MLHDYRLAAGPKDGPKDGPYVGSAVSLEDEVLATMRDWFAEVKLAGLVLPTGPFGRPFDNYHQLTWSIVRRPKVVLELDEVLHLIVTEPAAVEVDDDQLSISGFTQAVMDTQEFGSSRISHAEIYRSGKIKFIAQGSGIEK